MDACGQKRPKPNLKEKRSFWVIVKIRKGIMKKLGKKNLKGNSKIQINTAMLCKDKEQTAWRGIRGAIKAAVGEETDGAGTAYGLHQVFASEFLQGASS